MFRGGLFGAASWAMKIMRLISILTQRLASDARLAELAKNMREERSATVVLYDDYGNNLTICMAVGPDGISVSRGECSRPNNKIIMNINTVLDILEGRVDFRTAVAHGQIVIESYDGRPWFYHFVLWSRVWTMLSNMMRGRGQ